MKQSRVIMGMPVVLEVSDPQVTDMDMVAVFDFFREVDNRFSTFKPESEISAINAGVLTPAGSSQLMQQILAMCEQTKQETAGYFDINRGSQLDPSGLVKGWAVHQAADLLRAYGFANFYVDAGGDIEVSGHHASNLPWQIGIRNPFNHEEIVKVLSLDHGGVATSGTSARGQHVYNPHRQEQVLSEIVSITVVGPDIYEADRFATAAFAMQSQGAKFIESIPGLEAYMIDAAGIATLTTGFNQYLAST